MSQVVRFTGDDGAFMLVETTSVASDVGLVSDDTGLARATTKLEDSLDSIRGASVALLSTVNDMKGRDGRMALDEVSLELGLSFGAEGGVVVAKGSAKVQASVTITWKATKQVDES